MFHSTAPQLRPSFFQNEVKIAVKVLFILNSRKVLLIYSVNLLEVRAPSFSYKLLTLLNFFTFLHLLPVQKRVDYKTALLTFKGKRTSLWHATLYLRIAIFIPTSRSIMINWSDYVRLCQGCVRDVMQLRVSRNSLCRPSCSYSLQYTVFWRDSLTCSFLTG